MPIVAVEKTIPGARLGLDLFQRVLRHGQYRRCTIGDRGRSAQVSEQIQVGSVALFLVNSFVSFSHGLTVACQRSEGLIGQTITEHLVVEDANQAVAAADTGIEEGKRLARLQRLDPERDLAEFDRHRVAVDVEYAVRDDLAQGVLECLLAGCAQRAVAGDTGSGPAGGAEQEVAGSASGIDDREFQDFGHRIGGVARLRRVEHRIERGGEQELHEAVGRVVAAGRLAFVPSVCGVAHREAEVAGFQIHKRDQFEQAFVDRPEFFRFHVAPVHTGHGLPVGPEPGEMPDGLQQAAVGDAGAGQVGQVR